MKLEANIISTKSKALIDQYTKASTELVEKEKLISDQVASNIRWNEELTKKEHSLSTFDSELRIREARTNDLEQREEMHLANELAHKNAEDAFYSEVAQVKKKKNK